MSHRKFEQPRRGSLAFLPRKRCTRHRGKIKSFPKDDKSKKPHLTGFIGYKAGMTHIVRELDKAGSKMNKKEIVEGVTILETPPMVAVGIVGYKETPSGLKTLTTVWAQHLSEGFRRRLYRSWYRSKAKCFTKHTKNYNTKKSKEERRQAYERIEKNCSVVRVMCHTQIGKIPNLKQKKSHVIEIQVNGGSVKQKLHYAKSLLERQISVDKVFNKNEMIDTIAITKGHGFEGVVKRWGVRKLPRKTHKGLRKVGCIGAWHPERIRYTIPRAGQHGSHHRTLKNKKIYMLGKSINTPEGKLAGKTEFDITEKGINPMGGFPHYGTVRNEFIMLKGSIPGPVKRCITLRKSIVPVTTRPAKEQVTLKFIDTSSKLGRGRFQTHKEKKKFMGPLKKDLLKKKKKDQAKLALEARKRQKETQTAQTTTTTTQPSKKEPKQKKKKVETTTKPTTQPTTQQAATQPTTTNVATEPKKVETK